MTAPVEDTKPATEKTPPPAHTGGMIALVPDNPEELAVNGGDPHGELHLTLAYLGDDVSNYSDATVDHLVQHVGRMAQDLAPVSGRVMGHALWNPDGGPDGDREPCAVYQVQSHQGLEEIRNYANFGAQEGLGADYPQQHQPFLPHVTAGYGIQPAALAFAGPLKFSTIRLALGAENHDFPLTGESYGEIFAARRAEFAATTEPTPVAVPDLNADNGIPVTFPVIIVEGLETSDGRYIEPGALSHRALPLPILAQTKNPDGGEGHDGAEVIGRLDTLERVPGPEVIDKETGLPFAEGVFIWRGTGFVDPEEKGTQLAQKRYLTGNSADLSDLVAEFQFEEDGTERVTMTSGKIAATTLVPIPAFAQAYIQLDGQEILPNETALAASAGLPWRSSELGDDCFTCMAGIDLAPTPAAQGDDGKALIASGGILEISARPMEWFEDPGFTEYTPLTVTPEGRVFGHLAVWGTCHIGYAGQCVTPPRSATDYAYFRTGAVTVADPVTGEPRRVSVGHLTLRTGHAGMELSASDTAAHYDNTGTTAAYVSAGEDNIGPWLAGALKDDLDPATAAELAASPLSGDWRPVNGVLELVAALAVNVPGFLVPRARVASGAVVALVAAGQPPKAPPVDEAPPEVDEELADRIAELVVEKLAAAQASAKVAEHVELSLRSRAAMARIVL